MRLFSMLYQRVISWAAHHRAPYYLGAVSFVESSVFPIPPEVMLVSMTIAKPDNAWYYALITSVCSVLGGALGYIIGMFFFSLAHPLIQHLGYEANYQFVSHALAHWGFLMIVVAGFIPVPYKIFTIAAGALSMPFVPFMVASMISRTVRFFLVSGAMYWGGDRIHELLQRYIDHLVWFVIAGCVALYFLWSKNVI